MRRSFSAVTLFALALAAAACSTAAKPHRPPVVVTVRTATMDITPNVAVLARIRLPSGFVPLAPRGLMWLHGGREIGLVGVRQERTVILGYGGRGWRTGRVLAEDGAPGLDGGAIVDVAPSPSGMALAMAVVNSKQQRVDVVVRDLIARGGSGHSVASFNGVFQSASVHWLDQVTIALALGPRQTSAPGGAAPATPKSAGLKPAASAAVAKSSDLSAPGLYLIGISGMVTAELAGLKCPLSPLSWSPNGRFAVAEGGAKAPPELIRQDGDTCQALHARPGLRVLDWSPSGKSFLYAERGPNGEVATYRYDLATKRTRLIALSSAAAAFTGAGDVLALGSSALTFRGVRKFPDASTRAELALVKAKTKEIRMISLGFKTTAMMLAASTMSYSLASHSAAIATFGASPAGLLRKVIVYRLIDDNAFVVAFGRPAGPVLLGWDPGGRYLALADHNAIAAVLTVLRPPM